MSTKEMYRVTYVKKYASGDVTYVKFFPSYDEVIRWIGDYQSELYQIAEIEEYVINKTGAQ